MPTVQNTENPFFIFVEWGEVKNLGILELGHYVLDGIKVIGAEISTSSRLEVVEIVKMKKTRGIDVCMIEAQHSM